MQKKNNMTKKGMKKRVAVVAMASVLASITLLATGCYQGKDPEGLDTSLATIRAAATQETATLAENQTQAPAQNATTPAQPQTPAQVPQQQTSTAVEAYEEVTEAYYEEISPDVWETQTAEEYVAPAVECASSPNGYHSWLDVCEWYDGDTLINTGTSPASEYFTDSVYQYSICEYCGATR